MRNLIFGCVVGVTSGGTGVVGCGRAAAQDVSGTADAETTVVANSPSPLDVTLRVVQRTKEGRRFRSEVRFSCHRTFACRRRAVRRSGRRSPFRTMGRAGRQACACAVLHLCSAGAGRQPGPVRVRADHDRRARLRLRSLPTSRTSRPSTPIGCRGDSPRPMSRGQSPSGRRTDLRKSLCFL